MPHRNTHYRRRLRSQVDHSQVQRRQAGFTLIEVLVALAVFSSVIALMMFGLDQGRLQWQKATEQTQSYQQLLARKQWLTQLFEQANASLFRQTYASEVAYFLGDQQQLTFISNAPIVSGPGTYARVSLNVASQPNGQQKLVFKQWPYSDPYLGIHESVDPDQTLTLLENIQDVSWQYYFPARTEPTSMEIRQGGFEPRPEGYWSDQTYDAEYQQVLPPRVQLTFTQRGRRYQWRFYLPTDAEAYNQGDKLELMQ